MGTRRAFSTLQSHLRVCPNEPEPVRMASLFNPFCFCVLSLDNVLQLHPAMAMCTFANAHEEASGPCTTHFGPLHNVQILSNMQGGSRVWHTASRIHFCLIGTFSQHHLVSQHPSRPSSRQRAAPTNLRPEDRLLDMMEATEPQTTLVTTNVCNIHQFQNRLRRCFENDGNGSRAK